MAATFPPAQVQPLANDVVFVHKERLMLTHTQTHTRTLSKDKDSLPPCIPPSDFPCRWNSLAPISMLTSKSEPPSPAPTRGHAFRRSTCNNGIACSSVLAILVTCATLLAVAIIAAFACDRAGMTNGKHRKKEL
eukprot:1137446-Pelagomonas_calceolata.AAC.8